MKRITVLFITLLLYISCTNDKLILYEFHYPSKLNVVTCEEWGSVPETDSIRQHNIERITIHHGGVEFTKEKNVIEHLRNLQSWSRSEKGGLIFPTTF